MESSHDCAHHSKKCELFRETVADTRIIVAIPSRSSTESDRHNEIDQEVLETVMLVEEKMKDKPSSQKDTSRSTKVR